MSGSQKIIVIGCPGSGKSTFSRRLRDRTGLPLYYLDRIWHKADRTTVTEDEFDRALGDILCTDRWIIDGNFLRTMEMRLQACDTVFLLDLPTEACLEGVRSRIGTVREEMPWIEMEFDPEFHQYIQDFAADRLPQIYELLEKYKAGKKITVFHSREEIDSLFENGGCGLM